MPTETKITQLPETTDVRADALVPIAQVVDGQPATVATRVSRLRAAIGLRGLPGKQIEDEFGQYMNYTGSADMASVINDCISQYTTQGNPVMIGPGNYLNSSRILLVSNAQVLLSDRATLIRNFSTAGNLGHITQANFATPIENVKWQGGRIYNPSPLVLTGNAFSVNTNSSSFSRFFVDEWNGRAMVLFGARNKVHDFKAYSNITPGGGGLWVGQAEGTLVSNGDVRCDDDCYMWNLSANGAFVGGINRFNQYVNCYGESISARLLVIAASRAGVEPGIAGEIYGNEAVGMTGRCRLGVAIYNTLATGDIHDIHITNFSVDLTPNEGPNTAVGGIEIIGGRLGYPTVGGVKNVNFTNVFLKNPFGSAVRVRGLATGIVFRGGHFEASRTSGRATVDQNNFLDEDNGLSEVTYADLRIDGRDDADIARVGSDNLEQVEAKFNNVEFTNIGTNRRGIIVFSSGAGEIRGCTFGEASGASNARAFLIQAEANNFVVGRNNYDGVTSAAPVILQWDFDANNVWHDENVVSTAVNTTAAVHRSGTTFVLTAAGNRTLSLPAPAAGLRFRAVNSAGGFWIVSASAGVSIKIGTATSTAGGSITGTAVGDTVELIALDATTWLATNYTGTWTAA